MDHNSSSSLIDRRRPSALAIVPLLAAALLQLSSCNRGETPGPPIAPQGGEEMARMTIGTVPLYLQGDARWGDEQLGGSNQPLRNAGCVVCCISMGLTYLGIPMRPDQLTAMFKRDDGFTDRGLVNWDAVERASGGTVEVEIPASPSFSSIDGALRLHRPVLAKIFLASGINHWVLIVGKDHGEYLIHDPLGRVAPLEHLSQFGSNIHAIRILRRSAT